ncbi:MAG: T9SS type A sorting domain-containing protein [Calditrichaeota bacterium]|nr:T9SS type A sorting domain-containing protein [Calditrichota bacterium]MCB9369000.1 T9SS type A sorting domain-containing protein [Calditrichota bacterium]
MNWVFKLGIVVLAVVPAAFGQCIDSLWRTSPGLTDLQDLAGGVVVTQDGNVAIAGYMGYDGVPLAGYGVLKKINPSTGDEIWSHQYSGMGAQDIFLDVANTSDGGYICSGWSRQPVGNWQHYWLLKTNANGDSVWSKNFGTGEQVFQGRCAVQTNDGGFAIGGRVNGYPGGHGGYDWMIIKTDANGDSVWSVQIGDSLEDTMTDMIVSANGSIIAFGSSNTDTSREGMIAAVNQNGQLMWQRTYPLEISVTIQDLIELPEGGYMACGNLNVVNGNSETFIMEIRDNGFRSWEQRLDIVPDDDDVPYSIQPDGSGGWYLAGHGLYDDPGDLNVYVAHLSACGELANVRWLLHPVDDDERLSDGALAPGGQIVLCGNILDSVGERSWLVYGVSLDTCNVAPCTFDWVTPDYDELVETPDVTFSWTRANDPDGDDVTYLLHWESDYFYPTPDEQDVVLTDTFYVASVPWPVTPLDEIFTFHWRVWATDGQDTVEAASGENVFRMDITLDADEVALTPGSFELVAYPNPFNPTTTLTFSVDKTQAVTLDLFDVQGRLVETLVNETVGAGTHSVAFDGSNLSSGIYFANLRAGAKTRVTKLVLMK